MKLISSVLDVLYEKYYDITAPFFRVWDKFNYRYIKKYHLIDTKLSPGWHEFDTKLIHGMFEMMVDFVEIELAQLYLLTNKLSELKPEYGVWFLEEVVNSNGHYEEEKEYYSELYQIYKWYKESYLTRPDLFSVTGFHSIIYEIEEKHGTTNFLSPIWREVDTELCNRYKKIMYEIIPNQEKVWEDEETEMLTRLIKIRKFIWT